MSMFLRLFYINLLALRISNEAEDERVEEEVQLIRLTFEFIFH